MGMPPAQGQLQNVWLDYEDGNIAYICVVNASVRTLRVTLYF
jgi:hypothetical protein